MPKRGIMDKMNNKIKPILGDLQTYYKDNIFLSEHLSNIITKLLYP